jgi:predicted PurR-regulated permease PerM
MKTNNPVSHDVTHTTLTVLFIGILIASSFWILRPFLMAIIWAGLIVIATWPAMLKLEKWFAGKRGIAVTVMTLLILLIVVIPITLAVLSIINNVDDIIAKVNTLALSIVVTPPAWIEKIPFAGEKLTAKWSELASLNPDARSAMVVPHVKTALLWFAAQAGSIGMIVLQFVLTTIITAILYANGETVKSGFLSFARRLAGQQGEDVTILAAKSVRGVAMGVVVTAIIQTALGGIGLLVTGVPGAPILIAAMFMLCLAQIGPSLVLAPAVIWLYWKGDLMWGTVLLVFSILAATLDNFIRPVLIKKGADLPLLLIFTGVIGGLIAFGIIGLFIGPVVLAVTYTLLKEWVSGSRDGEEGVELEQETTEQPLA